MVGTVHRNSLISGAALAVSLLAASASADELATSELAGPNASTSPVDLSETSAASPAEAGGEGLDDAGSWLSAPSERRCGFSVGARLGGMAGSATGFPNDALKLDRPQFETNTGFGGGMGADLWIGMAMADWLTFGVGMGVGSLTSADHKTSFGAFIFHIDAFPAFGVGGAWRDLGLTLDAGIGGTTTTPSDDDTNRVIDSGAASKVGIGVFYEGIRAWKFSMGPFLSADLMFSPAASQPAAWLGWRTALYAGP